MARTRIPMAGITIIHIPTRISRARTGITTRTERTPPPRVDVHGGAAESDASTCTVSRRLTRSERARLPPPTSRIAVPVTPTLAYVLAILFVATLVRSTFGFGEALVAVPLLALAIPLDEAVPLGVLVSILVALVVILQDRRAIDFAGARGLLVAALFGLPLGFALLGFADPRAVKLALGALIAAYSVYSLVAPAPAPLGPDRELPARLACGFLSGVLGGAYGLNGPPLVVYGRLRGYTPHQLRATLQAYFLPASLLGFAGYAAQGLATRTVARDFLVCLPAVVPAIVLGRYLNRRLDGARFYRAVFGGLAVIGAILAAAAIRG